VVSNRRPSEVCNLGKGMFQESLGVNVVVSSCRDCSAAFHLTPYQGKYEAPNEAPDGLEVQKLLAGMADRGAEVAVVECNAEGLDRGRCVA
jgi:hypothetical protein